MHTDINSEGWISRLPEKWQAYALLLRLDRPTGWWLLLLPGWWGIMLGANGVQGMYAADWRLMIYFLLGAIMMRGVGCVINDIIDRDLDKQVERTRKRPLASGAVNVAEAGILAATLLFTSFIILLQTSAITIGLGALSLILIAIYPMMKRVTWWPQAFLGITFNFGALMGWSAATHRLDMEAAALYIGAFFWTLGYDTIYAHQDKVDDEIVGIKSTALLFGNRSKFWVSIFYLLAFAFICIAALLAQVGLVTLALLILPAIHFLRQIAEWDMDDAESSLFTFQSNKNFGLFVLLAFAFHSVLSLEIFANLPIPHIDFLGAAPQ